jgi:hypothetical protein
VRSDETVNAFIEHPEDMDELDRVVPFRVAAE